MTEVAQSSITEPLEFPVMRVEARTVLGCLLDNWAHRLNQGVDAAELNLEVSAVLAYVAKLLDVFETSLPESEALVSCQFCVPAFNIPTADAVDTGTEVREPLFQEAVEVFINTWHDALKSGRNVRSILTEIRAVAAYLWFTQELFQLHLNGKSPAAIVRIDAEVRNAPISADVAPWLEQCDVTELIKLSLGGWAGSLDVLMGNSLTTSVTDISEGTPVVVVNAEDARAWLATNRPSAWYTLLRAELDMEMNTTQPQLVASTDMASEQCAA